MVKKRKVLAIVMARGGSKGLPRKNLKLLGGYPLVAYSITSGLASKSINRVIVSTDDTEIATISKNFGAEVPFLRPREFAQDDTLDFPVIKHALWWLSKHESYHPDMIVQLRPTSPLRPKGLIDKSIELLLANPEADCVRGVTSPKQTPFKMWKEGENGYLKPLLNSDYEEPYNMPRQELPKCYWQTGHIDVIRAETVLKKKSLTGDNILPYYLDSLFSVDIDNNSDWELAEWRIKLLRNRIVQPNQKKKLLANIDLIVSDFDGVFTNNRVLVSEDGKESVECHRGDGMGIMMFRELNIPFYVISTEKNPVVKKRCDKLGIPCRIGIKDKKVELNNLVSELKVKIENVIYLGNDLNDVECIKMVGFGIAVADSVPDVLYAADYILSSRGGNGAVREIIDLILGNSN